MLVNARQSPGARRLENCPPQIVCAPNVISMASAISNPMVLPSNVVLPAPFIAFDHMQYAGRELHVRCRKYAARHSVWRCVGS